MRHGMPGIDQHIEKDLGELICSATDQWQRWWDVHRDRNTFALHARLDEAHGMQQGVVEGHWGPGVIRGAGKRQEPFNQACDALRLCDDGVQLRGLAPLLPQVHAEEFGIAPDDIERRADFVGEARGELAHQG